MENTKEVKLSEYLQHMKADEILLFNMKQYRMVERVGTLGFGVKASSNQLFVALSKGSLCGPSAPYL